MIKFYSKIFLALIVLISLACNLLSVPQVTYIINTEPVTDVVSEETQNYIQTGTYSTQTMIMGLCVFWRSKANQTYSFILIAIVVHHLITWVLFQDSFN